MFVLVLAILGMATGCGSDDADSSEKTLTKKQFIRLTEDFCDRENDAEEAEMKRYAAKHGLVFGGGKPWEEERIYQAVVLDYVRAKIAYFKSLPVPEGDDKEVRAMIEAFEEGLKTSEEVPASLAQPRPGTKPLPNPFEESYRTTEAYGPWLCGQP